MSFAEKAFRRTFFLPPSPRRVLFFDLFCLCGLWGAPEAARAFCELVFRMVLVPGLTSGHGVMYTESGDHRGATFELFQVLRSRTSYVRALLSTAARRCRDQCEA